MSTQQFRSLLKAILPPVLVSLYKRPKQDYGFFGNYSSWEEALANSTGYDSDVILNKVKNALLQVRDGKAVYERDSVLFDHIEYSFPLLAVLLKLALKNNGKLTIIDFGGSLGSSYYQCRSFLQDIKELKWYIIEQPKFVECGKKLFENDNLKFCFDIDEALTKNGNPDILLLSSVIQYLKDPFDFLLDITKHDFPYILFDRTTLSPYPEANILTIHHVSPLIYEAMIPTWLLSIEQILKQLSCKYELIIEFDSLSGEIEWNRKIIHEKGFLFRHRFIEQNPESLRDTIS